MQEKGSIDRSYSKNSNPHWGAFVLNPRDVPWGLENSATNLSTPGRRAPGDLRRRLLAFAVNISGASP
jgi:hypothetical protein